MLDVDVDEIIPKDPRVRFAGTTSDVTVFELDENHDSQGRSRYHVGDTVSFIPTYMGAARLMHSKFTMKSVK